MSIPELPAGWAGATVSDVMSINPKYSNPPSSDSTPVTFLPMASVEAESGVVHADRLRPWGEVRKGYVAFEEGDVLFAKITPCMENGKFAIARGLREGRGAGSTEFHVLRSRGIVEPSYLLHFLLQEQTRRNARARMQGAAGQLRVPKEYLETLEVPVPPANEQRRIVAALEEHLTRLDAAVAGLKRTQANLKRYRAAVLKAACQGQLVPTEAALARAGKTPWEHGSLLLERVKQELGSTRNPAQEVPSQSEESGLSALQPVPEGWTLTTLGNLVASMKNGIYKPREFYNENGVACLRMYNIEDGQIIWRDVKRMRLSVREIAEYSLHPGDILVNRVNSRELVGKAAVIPMWVEPCVFESKNIRVRLASTGLSSHFVSMCLSVWGGAYFDKNAQQVVGMASISQGQISRFPIPLPPSAEQHRIVAEVGRRFSIIDTLAKTVEAALTRAARLRQAILKRAFEGNLVPQDPNDEPASVLLERIRPRRELESPARKPRRARRRA